MHYNYHRYYDPTTGRYITPDPIGLVGGINPFVYVENNPANAIDPLGLARYFVSYDITSYSAVIAPVGYTKISGVVVSTQKNPDGTYTGIKFEGELTGAALGPLPWSKTINNSEYFEDNCNNPDVHRIEGISMYLSGSMALGKFGVSGGGYQLGDMEGTKKTPSGVEGLDLGVDFMMGRTWTIGPTLKFNPGIFPRSN